MTEFLLTKNDLHVSLSLSENILYVFSILPEFLFYVCVRIVFILCETMFASSHEVVTFPFTVKKLLRGSELSSHAITSTTQYIFRQFNPTVFLRAPFFLRTDFTGINFFFFFFLFFKHLMQSLALTARDTELILYSVGAPAASLALLLRRWE